MEDLEPGNSKEAKEAIEKANQEEYDLCMKFRRVFGSSEGKKVLENLKSVTLDAPTWNFGMKVKHATINGFAREGQNSIYRYIIEKLERADKLKEQINQNK